MPASVRRAVIAVAIAVAAMGLAAPAAAVPVRTELAGQPPVIRTTEVPPGVPTPVSVDADEVPDVRVTLDLGQAPPTPGLGGPGLPGGLFSLRVERLAAGSLPLMVQAELPGGAAAFGYDARATSAPLDATVRVDPAQVAAGSLVVSAETSPGSAAYTVTASAAGPVGTVATRLELPQPPATVQQTFSGAPAPALAVSAPGTFTAVSEGSLTLGGVVLSATLSATGAHQTARVGTTGSLPQSGGLRLSFGPQGADAADATVRAVANGAETARLRAAATKPPSVVDLSAADGAVSVAHLAPSLAALEIDLRNAAGWTTVSGKPLRRIAGRLEGVPPKLMLKAGGGPGGLEVTPDAGATVSRVFLRASSELPTLLGPGGLSGGGAPPAAPDPAPQRIEIQDLAAAFSAEMDLYRVSRASFARYEAGDPPRAAARFALASPARRPLSFRAVRQTSKNGPATSVAGNTTALPTSFELRIEGASVVLDVNGPLQVLSLDGRDLPLSARARDIDLNVSGIAGPLEARVGDDRSVRVLPTGTLGSIVLRLSDDAGRPYPGVPASRDGVRVTDVPEGYDAVARLTKLKRLRFEADPLWLRIDSTAQRVFMLTLDQRNDRVDRLLRVTLDKLPPDVTVRLVDGTPVRFIYNAKAAAPKLSVMVVGFRVGERFDRFRLTATGLPKRIDLRSGGRTLLEAKQPIGTVEAQLGSAGTRKALPWKGDGVHAVLREAGVTGVPSFVAVRLTGLRKVDLLEGGSRGRVEVRSGGKKPFRFHVERRFTESGAVREQRITGGIAKLPSRIQLELRPQGKERVLRWEASGPVSAFEVAGRGLELIPGWKGLERLGLSTESVPRVLQVRFSNDRVTFGADPAIDRLSAALYAQDSTRHKGGKLQASLDGVEIKSYAPRHLLLRLSNLKGATASLAADDRQVELRLDRRRPKNVVRKQPSFRAVFYGPPWQEVVDCTQLLPGAPCPESGKTVALRPGPEVLAQLVPPDRVKVRIRSIEEPAGVSLNKAPGSTATVVDYSASDPIPFITFKAVQKSRVFQGVVEDVPKTFTACYSTHRHCSPVKADVLRNFPGPELKPFKPEDYKTDPNDPPRANAVIEDLISRRVRRAVTGKARDEFRRRGKRIRVAWAQLNERIAASRKERRLGGKFSFAFKAASPVVASVVYCQAWRSCRPTIRDTALPSRSDTFLHLNRARLQRLDAELDFEPNSFGLSIDTELHIIKPRPQRGWIYLDTDDKPVDADVTIRLPIKNDFVGGLSGLLTGNYRALPLRLELDAFRAQNRLLRFDLYNTLRTSTYRVMESGSCSTGFEIGIENVSFALSPGLLILREILEAAVRRALC